MFPYILLLLNPYFISAAPNFVFVLTDDQDLLLNGMLPMRSTVKMVANKGKVFVNAFVNSPICCPNRGTILTGKYPHNTGVVNNSLEGNCASLQWQVHQEAFSIAAFLKSERKYTTFYAGKYLNQYGTKETGGTAHVPIGYDWWIGLKGNSRYYNYTLSINGSKVFHRNDYLTDVLANYSMEFLKFKPSNKPFFMMVAPPAPHAPFTPAKRHENAFPDTKAVRNPSFNFTPVEKHWIVGMPPTHLPANVTILDDIQRHRLQSLLSVDEMVAKIVNKLRQLGILDKTYVIFTSDNGFHIGQFTQPWDKRQPYETDVRVPMVIRGPKIPKKSLEKYPVSSVDIAPTILDLAGINIPVSMDGKSFKKALFARTRKSYKKFVFVEYWGEGKVATVDQSCPWKYDDNLAQCSRDQWCKCQDSRNNTYGCIISLTVTEEFKLCRFQDSENFVEWYNLTRDPYELTNIYAKLGRNVVEGYLNVLREFEGCSGRTCKRIKHVK